MNNKTYTNSAKYPLLFDRLHPGSLFRIHAEPSRGIYRSKDETVYRKARDHEGFYSYEESNKERCIVLMPEDRVQPVRADNS